MPKYSVFLQDPSDSTLYELLPKSYSFKEELNKESTAKIDISFEEFENTASTYNTTVLSILATSIMEIYIERDGTKIFYGVLSDLDLSTGKEGERTLHLKAVGFIGLFSKRIAGIPSRIFSSTDAGAIAWALINDIFLPFTFFLWIFNAPGSGWFFNIAEIALFLSIPKTSATLSAMMIFSSCSR